MVRRRVGRDARYGEPDEASPGAGPHARAPCAGSRERAPHVFCVAAQVATALRRLNATGRTPITPVPAHKLNVFGKAVESGCLFFGDTMVERHALSAQARSSPCDGHRP